MYSPIHLYTYTRPIHQIRCITQALRQRSPQTRWHMAQVKHGPLQTSSKCNGCNGYVTAARPLFTHTATPFGSRTVPCFPARPALNEAIGRLCYLREDERSAKQHTRLHLSAHHAATESFKAAAQAENTERLAISHLGWISSKMSRK